MKKKFKENIIKILYSLKIVIKSEPIYFTFLCIINLLLGLVLAYNTVLLDKFFNAIQQYLNSGVEYINVLFIFILLILNILANPILNGLNTVFGTDFENKAIGILEKNFNYKCSKFKTTYFEDTIFLEEINKAQNGVKSTVYLVTNVVGAFFIYLPYFITIGIYFYRLKPTLIFIMILFFIPTIFSQIYKKKLFEKLEDTIAPLRRECNHYLDCMINEEKIKETRMLGVFLFFMNLYKEKLNKLNKEVLNTEIHTIKVEVVFKIPVVIVNILTLILLLKYLIDRVITVGNFGAIVSSLLMLSLMIQELIFYVIGNSLKQIGSVDNYIKFMIKNIEVKKAYQFNNPPQIELKNISFSYHGCSKNAVENVSLKINRGELVVIVGENGSGKTTLVNLLSGLYVPSKGTILYDGIDIIKENLDISCNISGIFQDFKKYKMTLLDNIIISDFYKKYTHEYIDNILEKNYIDINCNIFPNGLKTILSREFDGVDISGGQWQKVAIARGDYKKSNMIILDEPTSSIDPLEESKLFKKFIEISKNKTTFIVTHRLSLSRLANKIIVMDKGNIIQVGNHNELINIKGKYSELYNIQSKAYLADFQ